MTQRTQFPDNRIKLQKAGLDDVPVIHALIQELADYEKMRSEMIATPNMLKETLFDNPNPAAEVILAILDNETPVGFALFFHNYSTFLGKPGLYLEDLFVKPEFRGCGIGKRLLARLAEIAVERNCGRMEWSVLNWNEPAIRFYESLGAKPMNEWTTFRLTGDQLSGLAGAE